MEEMYKEFSARFKKFNVKFLTSHYDLSSQNPQVRYLELNYNSVHFSKDAIVLRRFLLYLFYEIGRWSLSYRIHCC